MLLWIFLLLPMVLGAQGVDTSTNEAIPLGANIQAQSDIAQNYRPGLPFSSASLSSSSSLNNLIPSPTVKAESSTAGRHGALRIDGAAALPLLGIDGFVIKDSSINQGQIKLELIPFDFAERVDIYNQNLVPFGIGAGSFIDFRIPLHFRNRFTTHVKAGTLGSLYTKNQLERTFKGGSTLFGVVTDNLFADYTYGVNGGSGFKVYPFSTYQRYSVLSKTHWNNLEVLIGNTYTQSFGESGDLGFEVMRLIRNNLITGVKYSRNGWFVQGNYNFYNHFIQYTSGVTNEYNNHNLNLSGGYRGQSSRLRYQVMGGYEFQTVEDGARANVSNYLTVPPFGEQFFNLQADVTADLLNPDKNRPFQLELNLALNQILSIYGKYVPVPSLGWGFRHRKGWYGSIFVNRVYLIPDLTTAYGFGFLPDEIPPTLNPKDGIRTGVEIGLNAMKGRIFLRASYAWLDQSFRLAENNTVVNAENVQNAAVEIGGSVKAFHRGSVFEFSAGGAFNYEIDSQGQWASVIPIWKLTAVFSIYDPGDSWRFALNYRFEYLVPNARPFFLDRTPRHYLDLHARYKWFFINILNLANQSYRPIPENTYSPYNPGIRAEIGVELNF